MSSTEFSILYTFKDAAHAELMESALRTYMWNQEINEQAGGKAAISLDALGVDARPLLSELREYYYLNVVCALDEHRVIVLGEGSKLYGYAVVRQFLSCFKPCALVSITAITLSPISLSYSFDCFDGQRDYCYFVEDDVNDPVLKACKSAEPKMASQYGERYHDVILQFCREGRLEI